MSSEKKSLILLRQIIEKSVYDDSSKNNLEGAESWITFHLNILKELLERGE